MARRPLPSVAFSAALRARLGITQQELGDFLGVRAAQMGHVEAGRRGYSARAQVRLYRLAGLVPAAPTLKPVADEPPAGLTAGEARALRARLRACRHDARQLRYQQAALPGKAAALVLRRHTAATLQAAQPALAADEMNALRVQEWVALLALATKRLARLAPSATARALLELRQRLAAEALAAHGG